MPQKSAREIYRDSADHVSFALELLGTQSTEESARPPSDSEFEALSRALSSIRAEHRNEAESSYRTTILQLARWLDCALQPTFALAPHGEGPHPLYVIRKGLEVLHMLLHRDLRRKNLSSAESQIYYDFVRLTTKLPKPPERATGTARSGTGS